MQEYVINEMKALQCLIIVQIKNTFTLPLLHTVSFSKSERHKNKISSKQKTKPNLIYITYRTAHISLSWILELTKDNTVTVL